MLQKDHFFKVGGTTKKLIKSRLSTYNTGEHPDIKFYYVYIKECINYKVIEEKFKSAFKSFIIEEDKELYNMQFEDIKYYIDSFVEDENNSMLKKYDLNNDLFKNKLYDNLLEVAKFIQPIIVTQEITNKANNKIIDQLVLDDLCKGEFANIVVEIYNNLEEKNNIQRKTLESFFDSQGYKIKGKKNMWNTSKDILREVNPNIKFKY